jgi:alanine racemase
MIDLGSGDDADAVEVGTEVVLLGRQGGVPRGDGGVVPPQDEIAAAEWAEKLGTIPYEVCCGIGERVPRRYSG